MTFLWLGWDCQFWGGQPQWQSAISYSIISINTASTNPTGGGGLTKYFDQYASKLARSPKKQGKS